MKNKLTITIATVLMFMAFVITSVTLLFFRLGELEKFKIMEHISFVLWLLGFPITIALIEFLESAERQFKPKEPKSDDKSSLPMVLLVFYIVIATSLY